MAANPGKQQFLFEGPQRRAGASPWARYKSSAGGTHNVSVGFLTSQINDKDFILFLAWAERTDQWRDRLGEVLIELCSN